MQNISFLGDVQRLPRVGWGWVGLGGGWEKLEIRLSSAQLQLGLGLSLAINTNCHFLDTLLGYMKFQKLEMFKLD